MSSRSQGSSTLSVASDCNPSQGQESHPVGHHPQEPVVSTGHPTPAGDWSPHLLTFPPADGTWTCTHAISELWKKPAKTTGKLAVWVGTPTHGEEEASRCQLLQHTQMPRPPASCLPASESPRERRSFPTDVPGCPVFPESPRPPSPESHRAGHGELWSQDTVWLQVIQQRIPELHHFSGPLGFVPLHMLYVCLGCCSTSMPNDVVETHRGAAAGQIRDNLSIKYREGHIITC